MAIPKRSLNFMVKRKKSRPRFKMRQCLCGCKEPFYPAREWQRYITPAHSNRHRQKKLRDRYKELVHLDGDIARSRMRNEDILDYMAKHNCSRSTAYRKLKALKDKLKEESKEGQAVDNSPPHNRSPENGPATGGNSGGGGGPLIPLRLRKLTRVHPRSLEMLKNQE